jgi:hypothetical protein
VLLAHALEVRVRDLQLVGQLAARQRRDAVAHRVAGFVDDDVRLAVVAGAVMHQLRRHDQVLLRVQLALQFLGQAHEGTSALHDFLQSGWGV